MAALSQVACRGDLGRSGNDGRLYGRQRTVFPFFTHDPVAAQH